MTDLELAAHWDSDHRLAAVTALAAGALAVVGAALWSWGSSEIVGGGAAAVPSAFVVGLVAASLLLTDVALLVFIVGLAHAVSRSRFGVGLTTAVATLATTAAATLHLVWGHVPLGLEVTLPPEVVDFSTWLALNIWLLPLFGLLVGVTLVALGLALRTSDFTFARRVAVPALVAGATLCLLVPFAGFGPEQSALVAVAAIVVACLAVGGLLLATLVWLGMVLARTRTHTPHHEAAGV